jgi:hypothetical protein
MFKVWNDLYSLTDKYTDGWLSSGFFGGLFLLLKILHDIYLRLMEKRY